MSRIASDGVALPQPKAALPHLVPHLDHDQLLLAYSNYLSNAPLNHHTISESMGISTIWIHAIVSVGAKM